MYSIFNNKQYTRTFKFEYVGLDTFKYQTNSRPTLSRNSKTGTVCWYVITEMIHPEYSTNPGTSEEPPQVQTASDVAKNGKHISLEYHKLTVLFFF